MEATSGEARDAALGLAFDRRLKLEFHGTRTTSDGGLLACRELDDTLGLSETAGEGLTDTRTGANGHHSLVRQFRQSVFGRLAGYEDVNDADRLAHDPAMRWVVGDQARNGTSGLDQPDGPLRDRGADPSGEPVRAQRPLRRGLARRAGAGGRPLPDHHEAALFP